MGPEQERLRDRLIESGTRNFKIFRGDKPASPEEICKQVNDALDEIEGQEGSKFADLPSPE